MRIRGMGRIYIPDPRDNHYPMSSILQQTDLRKKDWWDEGWWGDQGYDPYCVAFSWAHWLADGPRPNSIFESRRPGVDTRELYCEAQKRDPWPGNCDYPLYDGTSVRAGAKVLQEWGFIREYRWARNGQELAQAVLNIGPVILGTMWYEGMGYPDSNGIMNITGSPWGGHAYVVNAVDLDTGLFTIKNSWGQGWGLNGRAYLRLADADVLIRAAGEACVAVQS